MADVDQPKPSWIRRQAERAREAQDLFEAVAKGLIIFLMLLSMGIIGWIADPAKDGRGIKMADRLLSWSFVVFSVGTGELFILFIVMSVLGKIDLAQAFYEKMPDESARAGDDKSARTEIKALTTPAASVTESPAATSNPGDGRVETKPADKPRRVKSTKEKVQQPVSLSRLQAFMWTLIVMTVYFHRVVKDDNNGLPAIPPELLMVMGISSAVYLTSKSMSTSSKPKQET